MLAALFPGQGSGRPGDRDDVARLAPDLLEMSVSAAGSDPFLRAGESTRYAQPAIFVTSLARWRAAGLEPAPAAFAGHSLGEITALTAAGSISIEDGLRLVAERGRLMAAARAGGMLVVRGGIDEAGQLADRAGLTVANDNAPGQVVLSGASDAIDNAARTARELGLRAVRLDVTGAFHSPLMAEAAEAFTEVLAGVTFSEPSAPVWCCATAAPFTDPQAQLAAALTAPVRWRELVLAMEESGIKRFADIGPGGVLDGLTRRIVPEAERVEVLSDALA